MPDRPLATAPWSLLVAAVLVVAVGAGIGLVALTGMPQRPDLPAAARAAGAVVAVAGVGLAAWTFGHHPPALMARVTGRTIEVTMKKLAPGEGIVPRLITSGPYGLVRNPIYLSVLLLVWGLGLALPLSGLVVAGVLLLVWWNLVVIPPEERELRARFGQEYDDYRARTWRFVPRWK